MSDRHRYWLRDNRGQLLTLDLLVSLIPLVLVLGISANTMSGVVTQVQDYSNTYDDQRVLQDAADALIKSPGEPVDWDGSTILPDVLGLVQYYPGNIIYTNSMSAGGINLVVKDLINSESASSHKLYREKFNFLKTAGNEEYLYNLTRTDNTYLTFKNMSSGASLDEAVGTAPPANASQIYKVERRVLFEYIPVDASNLTTIMLYQKTISDAVEWENYCGGPFNDTGTKSCTIVNNLVINFTLPHNDFAGTCFNITGNFNPYSAYNATYRTFSFNVNDIDVSDEDMDDSASCDSGWDGNIEIVINDGSIEGDEENPVYGETGWLNDSLIHTVEIDSIEVALEDISASCSPTCFPTDSITFEIGVEIPLTTYYTNYAEMVIQTWES
jgi:hypothetical protein